MEISLFLLGLLLFFAICMFFVIQYRRAWARFNQQYPPISDAEFVALCKPGINPEIALKVRRIVSANLGVPYEQVYPSQSFAEDLGID